SPTTLQTESRTLYVTPMSGKNAKNQQQTTTYTSSFQLALYGADGHPADMDELLVTASVAGVPRGVWTDVAPSGSQPKMPSGDSSQRVMPDALVGITIAPKSQ